MTKDFSPPAWAEIGKLDNWAIGHPSKEAQAFRELYVAHDVAVNDLADEGERERNRCDAWEACEGRVVDLIDVGAPDGQISAGLAACAQYYETRLKVLRGRAP